MVFSQVFSRVFSTLLWKLFIREKNEKGRTCGKVLIDWPVVHLQSGITPVPGEPHQVVFAVVDGRRRLLDTDVHRPNVESHTYFALLLEKKTPRKKKKGVICLILPVNEIKIPQTQDGATPA